ncbi:UNVERIFIED_CONTAM: hypothetical protein HDU68_008273 [Siphonaria sp. JEL0065]|nr:hypothetical protein HDU68_008273 [Siphonaria sp. JEL0065]
MKLPQLPCLPRLPRWEELKYATPMSSASLRAPGMPTDPTFLDKPVRDYMMRYFTILPIFNIADLILWITVGATKVSDYSTLWTLADISLSASFCLFGYYSLKGMIPERLIITGYFFLLRSFISLILSLLNLTPLSPNISLINTSNDKNQNDTVSDNAPSASENTEAVFVSVLIVIVLFLCAPMLLNYVFIWKIMNPLISYAQECRKRLVVDLVELSANLKASAGAIVVDIDIL